jgi:replicative DNA helicase
MGKSQFVVNLCLNMLPSHPVAYFSIDLNKTHLLARLLASKTTIAANSILQKQLSPDEINVLEKAAVEISTSNLYVSDLPVYDLYLFEEECRRLVREHNVQVIAVDYIQLIGKPSAAYYSNRDRELATISRCIKNLAKELNVLFLCVSQLSRSVETRGGEKKPQLSDLRDSGSLEQDADKVILLYRPEYYNLFEDCNGENLRGKMEVILAKNKHGRTGSIHLMRTPEFTSFSDIAFTAPDSKLEIKADRMKDFDFF